MTLDRPVGRRQRSWHTFSVARETVGRAARHICGASGIEGVRGRHSATLLAEKCFLSKRVGDGRLLCYPLRFSLVSSSLHKFSQLKRAVRIGPGDPGPGLRAGPVLDRPGTSMF
jgi:hypothetical protein